LRTSIPDAAGNNPVPPPAGTFLSGPRGFLPPRTLPRCELQGGPQRARRHEIPLRCRFSKPCSEAMFRSHVQKPCSEEATFRRHGQKLCSEAAFKRNGQASDRSRLIGPGRPIGIFVTFASMTFVTRTARILQVSDQTIVDDLAAPDVMSR
jgi:hypothetical protein